MRENSKIKQKILQYLEIKGITKYEFYQKTGISNGVLSQNNGLSEENLLRFLSYYLDVSAEWLLRDRGEMLQDLPETPSQETFPHDNIVLSLIRRNEELARENGQLQAEIAELKKELAHAASTMAASARLA